MKLIPNTSTIYKCECHTHGLIIDFDQEDDLVTLHPWQWEYYQAGWRGRLAYAWHIIKNGTPYESICLHGQTAIALATEILEKRDQAKEPIQ